MVKIDRISEILFRVVSSKLYILLFILLSLIRLMRMSSWSVINVDFRFIRFLSGISFFIILVQLLVFSVFLLIGRRSAVASVFKPKAISFLDTIFIAVSNLFLVLSIVVLSSLILLFLYRM